MGLNPHWRHCHLKIAHQFVPYQYVCFLSYGTKRWLSTSTSCWLSTKSWQINFLHHSVKYVNTQKRIKTTEEIVFLKILELEFVFIMDSSSQKRNKSKMFTCVHYHFHSCILNWSFYWNNCRFICSWIERIVDSYVVVRNIIEIFHVRLCFPRFSVLTFWKAIV